MMHRRDLHPQFQIYQVSISYILIKFLSLMWPVYFSLFVMAFFRHTCLISLIRESEEGFMLNH